MQVEVSSFCNKVMLLDFKLKILIFFMLLTFLKREINLNNIVELHMM
jgi:hypothetical protein